LHEHKNSSALPPNLVFVAGIGKKIVELHGPGQIGCQLRRSVLVRSGVSGMHAAIGIDSGNQAIKIAVPIERANK
jgi:hypothetical protein